MTTDEAVLSPKMFTLFCDLVYDKAGIKMGAQKEALVSARVGRRMRQLGLDKFEEYYRLIEKDPTGEELVELLNVISTNVTHFFRESHHFDLLNLYLKEWESEGQKSFKIWCAASSTGEEPYSIAITVKDSLRDSSDVKILATDISTKVLALAKAGTYTPRQMEKVPAPAITKHFRKVSTAGNRTPQPDTENPPSSSFEYQVSDDLRRMLTFARLNLAKPPFPMKGPFDVVFCRNVMIYFDNVVRKKLLAEAWRLLKPGGYFMVGHSESLSGMLSNFTSVEPSVYVKG